MSKTKYEVAREAEAKLKPLKESILAEDAATTSPKKGGGGFDDDAESIYDVPLPPDGGWGWLVMMASFFTNLLVDGVCYTYATVYQGLMDTFEAGDTITALVGSLLPGMYLICGEGGLGVWWV